MVCYGQRLGGSEGVKGCGTCEICIKEQAGKWMTGKSALIGHEDRAENEDGALNRSYGAMLMVSLALHPYFHRHLTCRPERLFPQ